MVRTTGYVAAALVLFVTAEVLGGQVGYLWSFPERLDQADIVVIATKGTTRDTGAKTVIGMGVVCSVATTPPAFTLSLWQLRQY
jgi:hypothetical protein